MLAACDGAPVNTSGYQRLGWAPLLGSTPCILGNTYVPEDDGSFVFGTFLLCPESRPLASSNLYPFTVMQLQWWIEHFPEFWVIPRNYQAWGWLWGPSNLWPAGRKWWQPWGLAHPQQSWAGAGKTREERLQRKGSGYQEVCTPGKVCASPGPKRAARENRGLYHLASTSPKSVDCQACDFQEQERARCSARSGCPGGLEDIVHSGKVPPGLPKNSQRKRFGACHLWAIGARWSYQLAGDSNRGQWGDRGLFLSPSPFPSTPDKLEPGRGKKGTASKQTTWRECKCHFPTAGPPAFLPTGDKKFCIENEILLKADRLLEMESD